MAEAKESQPDNMWRIRDVDPDIRKKIKWYAVQHEMSIAEALKELVGIALGRKHE